ncbi:MAG: right-handed parallel beta-helix repeat-containing protein [Candidatus Hydrogenedentota bacterium]
MTNRTHTTSLLFGCGMLWASFAVATTYTVSEGMVIQETIDKAVSGDTIQVLPGDYQQAIRIDKDGLTVIGMEFQGIHAVLDGLDVYSTEKAPRAISIEANDVVCDGFHIRNFSSPAVEVLKRSNITLTKLDVHVDGDYGILLEDVTPLQITSTIVRGANEVGIALRRCQDAVLTRCEVYYNRIGVAMWDGVKSRIEGLSAHTNGMGILIANTDGQPEKAEHTLILGARILNTGTIHAPDAKTSAIPDYLQGIGIRIVGASHTEVAHCYFDNNGSVGVLTDQWIGSGDAEPYPAQHTYVHHNHYAGNGKAPSAGYAKAYPEFPGGDLYWDGEGRRNQWQENGNLAVYPEKLITKFGGVHTNVMHFQ